MKEEARWKILKRKKLEKKTRRLLQNRTQWSGVFLASSPNFCSPVCFSRNGCLCIEYTSQSLVQKTVQMPQFINRWGAATGVIRRYGSLMRPGRSTPPIYTCFDPSGVRKEGRGGGGCDRKVLSARMFFICSSSLACACVASS